MSHSTHSPTGNEPALPKSIMCEVCLREDSKISRRERKVVVTLPANVNLKDVLRTPPGPIAECPEKS